MLVNPSEKVKLLREEHPLNAPASIFLIGAFSSTVSRAVQLLNAELEKVSNVDGSFTLFSAVKSLKAELPTEVIPSGTTRFSRADLSPQ